MVAPMTSRGIGYMQAMLAYQSAKRMLGHIGSALGDAGYVAGIMLDPAGAKEDLSIDKAPRKPIGGGTLFKGRGERVTAPQGEKIENERPAASK